MLKSRNMRLYWLGAALILSTVLTTLNMFALENYWYWFYSWSDVPMHILGGITLGTFLIALFQKRRPVLYMVVLTGCFIGWEVFEYIGGITSHEANYVFDTFTDLLNDVLGAVCIYFVARLSVWR